MELFEMIRRGHAGGEMIRHGEETQRAPPDGATGLENVISPGFAPA